MGRARAALDAGHGPGSVRSLRGVDRASTEQALDSSCGHAAQSCGAPGRYPRIRVHFRDDVRLARREPARRGPRRRGHVRAERLAAAGADGRGREPAALRHREAAGRQHPHAPVAGWPGHGARADPVPAARRLDRLAGDGRRAAGSDAGRTGSAWSPSRSVREDVESFYEGFSNGTLWPLYHDAVPDSQFHRDWWEAYQRVNERFARMAAATGGAQRDGLGARLPVAARAQAAAPAATRRADRLLPAHSLPAGGAVHAAAVAAADHRRPARRRPDRLPTARRRAQLRPAGEDPHRRRRRAAARSSYDGRTIHAGAFPISIDSAEQSALAATPEVHAAARRLRADLGEPRRLILGVDRLDYTKGIDVRLRAFGELLAEDDPAVHDAVMVQIATPSRERLESYQKMRDDDRASGRLAERRLRPDRPPRGALPAPVAAAGGARLLLRRGRCDDGDAAPRRHEPRGQGVRRLPGRRRRRAAALRVHRRRQGTAGRSAGQPVRHRRREVRPCGGR